MHPMKRAFLIVLFGLGTVGGFAHGFASLGHCASRHHGERRMEFEDHVADVCLRAAERRGPHHPPPPWSGGPPPGAPPAGPFPPPGE
jgi:hypothetical protein